jgi:GDP/UDP-N,N'-diacetylbacillosamine 2-epimerase (hydrolysing)
MKFIRKIIYVSGSRADFGLMLPTLNAINKCTQFKLNVICVGQHLNQNQGNTINDITSSKIPYTALEEHDYCDNDSINMSLLISNVIEKISFLLQKKRPDVLIVLGDRVEMLGAAIAATVLNIPIIHIHGGERSGSIDESIRHAISKLSHFHFVANTQSKERLIKMGERQKFIFNVGAPGLSLPHLKDLLTISELNKKIGLNLDEPTITVIFHPVVQDLRRLVQEINVVFKSIHELGLQTVVFLPNSDATGALLETAIISSAKKIKNKTFIRHLNRHDYLSLLIHSKLMIGNSSSGIIESVNFGLPVINVGERQNLRDRNKNVFDFNGYDIVKLKILITKLITGEKMFYKNIYGDGRAPSKILKILQKLKINEKTLKKVNSY